MANRLVSERGVLRGIAKERGLQSLCRRRNKRSGFPKEEKKQIPPEAHETGKEAFEKVVNQEGYIT